MLNGGCGAVLGDILTNYESICILFIFLETRKYGPRVPLIAQRDQSRCTRKSEMRRTAPIGRNAYFQQSNVIPVSKAVDLENEHPPHKNDLHPFSSSRGG